MPKFKLKLDEPNPRLFSDYGELEDGAIVEASDQPADGVTWTWAKAGNATPDVVEPVVPDSASVVIPETPAEPSA